MKSSFAIIKRICSYIPPLNYKNIYHTLFESHLLYGISVWGNARKSSINQLFTIQKKLVRYLFGNYESFLEKHCTSASTRPYGKQILGSDFYQEEHTKPLFNENKLLTVHNLHKYMSTNEICIIITSKTPSSLYDSVNFSSRNKRNVIILPKRNLLHNHSTYAACSSGLFYEGANFMINGLPEISISFFSELASIIYCLGFHNLFVNMISILETKLYQRPVAVMHWRVCYIMGAD